MRVCGKWGSLLLNDKTSAVCEEQACTDWLSEYFQQAGFMPAAQNTVVRTFGLGTGAWALWVDADAGKVRVRHYDARMVLPLTWDEEGVSECAFVTRAFYRGKAVNQLQTHLRGSDGLASPSAHLRMEQRPRGHEHALEVSLANTSHAVPHCTRAFGESLPDKGNIGVSFDGSIITDTAAEKRLAMEKVGVTLHPYEYRMRFYGEDGKTARKRAEGLGTSDGSGKVA